MDLGGGSKGKDGGRPDKPSASNPRAIPPLQLVLSATKGVTDTFSNVGKHVNSSLKGFGKKETGTGSGIGFGHGFGIGLAKPGVVNRFKYSVGRTMIKMMIKFGMLPSFPFSQGSIPGTLQSSIRIISGTSDTTVQNTIGSILQLAAKTSETTPRAPSSDGESLNSESKYKSSTSKGIPSAVSLGSHSEKVIKDFLQSPILRNEETVVNKAGQLESESNVQQTLLKHQRSIEELKVENEKLRRVLVEDLKVPPSKLQASVDKRT